MALLNLLQMLSHTSSDVRIAACVAFSCIEKYAKNISDQKILYLHQRGSHKLP